MEFIVAAFGTPIALLSVIVGLGNLFQGKKSDHYHPQHIIALLGLVNLIVIGQTLSLNSFTVKFITGSSISLTLLGFYFNRHRWRSLRRNLHFFLVFSITYLLAASPLFALEEVTWTGWVQLDDTATFLAMTNHLFEKGQGTVSSLISTYDRTIDVNFSNNYPIGALIPIGMVGQILNIDTAWLYFPILCSLIAIFSLCLYGYLLEKTERRVFSMFAAVFSSQAATYYAYALWGGIKELILPPIILLITVILGNLVIKSDLPKQQFWRELLVLAGAIYALYSVGGRSAIGYALVPLLLFFSLRLKEYFEVERRKSLILLGGIILFIILSRDFILNFLNNNVITKIPDSGNLARQLNVFQSFGIWPSGDFRSDLKYTPISYLIIGICICLSILGLIISIQKKEYVIFVLGTSTLLIVIYSSLFSGIWLTGKAIAVASPFLVMAAFYSSSFFSENGRIGKKSIPSILSFFLCSGIFGSNYLAFGNVWMAPSVKNGELLQIGNLFAGQGPALMTDYSTFGARYFLRELSAESVSELRVNLIPTREGKEVPKGFSADIDLFDNSEISKYPLLVLKHTAVNSRPLQNYDLVFEGRYYDVWKLNDVEKRDSILSLALGDNLQPGSIPDCQVLGKFLNEHSGPIYFVEREPIYYVGLSNSGDETYTDKQMGNLESVSTAEFESVSQILEVKESGVYEFFIGGSVPGKMDVVINLKKVYSVGNLFEGNRYLSNYVFSSYLNSGKNLIQVQYHKPIFTPGAQVETFMGPLSATLRTAADFKVQAVEPKSKLTLCEKNLDWIAISTN